MECVRPTCVESRVRGKREAIPVPEVSTQSSLCVAPSVGPSGLRIKLSYLKSSDKTHAGGVPKSITRQPLAPSSNSDTVDSCRAEGATCGKLMSGMWMGGHAVPMLRILVAGDCAY
jgi:hypothetical protein